MSRKYDLTGNRYKHLLVIKEDQPRVYKSGGVDRRWECRCDCGNTKTILQSCLVNNKTSSCGCELSTEIRRKGSTTHGMNNSSVYSIWAGMKGRCNSPLSSNYKYYGGRGITYESKWETFQGFWDDMESTYKDGLSLDRIDGDRGYCKENCRWISMKLQQRNRAKSTLNTSGVNGVYYEGGKSNRWVATWNCMDSSRKKKSFSCNKLGYDKAFTLACEFRELQINLLNLKGAGYTDLHGK